MNKKEIRTSYKEKRAAISDSEFAKLTDLLLIQFQSLHLEIPDNILSYLPFTKYNEIDLAIIEDYCKWKNPIANLCYPVVNEATNNMEAVSTTADQAFVENSYGVEEPFGGTPILPRELDMIFVPLLAFDKVGYRVGYGKGYYDRYLVNCNKDILKIGFSFYEALENNIDVNEFDIALDLCITPNKIYQF